MAKKKKDLIASKGDQVSGDVRPGDVLPASQKDAGQKPRVYTYTRKAPEPTMRAGSNVSKFEARLAAWKAGSKTQEVKKTTWGRNPAAPFEPDREFQRLSPPTNKTWGREIARVCVRLLHGAPYVNLVREEKHELLKELVRSGLVLHGRLTDEGRQMALDSLDANAGA